MPKITEMFAFVAADGGPDDEGIMGALVPGPDGTPMMMPLVGADIGRVKSIKQHADMIRKATGKPYKILRFKLVGEIDKETL